MEKDRRKIFVRLRRIEGQVRGLQRMIEKEAPCIDVLTQVSAVISAMKQTGSAIIHANMKRCMREPVRRTGKGMEDFQKALSRYIDLA